MESKNTQQVNGKGKSKQDYNAWTVEGSRMLLQLMVDAASSGWRDAKGMLSKATVEIKILSKINEKLRCHKTYSQYQSRLKYFKREYQKYSQLLRHSSGFGWDPTTKKFTTPKEVWKDCFKSHPKDTSIQTKTCEDYEDLQIVIGNATAIGRNSLGLGDDIDARTFRAEDRHVGIEDFVFDDESQAFIPNHNEPPHQDPSLGHSSSSFLFHATNCEGPSESSSQRK
ncbi:uncharacterized protein At2g29880-like [Prunus dulcis]|uniref:uncharacterized protein At2g29880-like n=1 Tax=Prunus dulcis TaxID=3755 RepID=UPI001482AA00|nr:uncharacterized protein At2g29880-like [Prunus dulcis]